MLKDLNYVAFDFETTGLDLQKDEPIQFGLIQFDKDFNIKKRYSTYIKPQKNIKELKDIVLFITGLKLDDLKSAPKMQDVLPEIKEFFDDQTILIGHNVMFDINFLKKYMPGLSYMGYIDTFVLARNIMHFAPSYALEIINEVMEEKSLGCDISSILDINQVGYHDALYDSAASYRIFEYFISHLGELIQQYPVLAQLISKSDSVYNKILDLSSYDTNIPENKLFLPSFSKEIKDKQKIYSTNARDLTGYANFTKFYIGNIEFKQALSNLLGKGEKTIFLFSHRSKVKIAENVLSELGVKAGTLYDDAVFNTDRIQRFLTKSKFAEFEINFLIKYFSMYDQGISFFYSNSPEDYKIENFLKQKTDKKKTDVLVGMHSGFWDAMKQNKDISEYRVIFWDWDWWYYSMVKYVNRPLDIYYFIGFVENLIYKKSFQKNSSEKLNKFYNWLLVFTGVFFAQLTDKFKNIQPNRIEIGPITTDTDFYKTTDMLKDVHLLVEEISPELAPQDFHELKNRFEQLDDMLNNIVQVERKMYSEDNFYFVFYPTNNVVNYQEFLSMFGEQQVFFMTNNTKDNAIILDENNKFVGKQNAVTKQKNRDVLIDMATSGTSTFILSSTRTKSKELFEYLVSKNLQEDFNIFVDNITGGIGKNVFYAKRKNNKIMIGGYEYFLSLLAEKVQIDKMIVYSAEGPFEKVIINDMKYYAQTYQKDV